MNIHDTIAHLAEGNHLTRDQAADAMRFLMSGKATPAQMGALLLALRMKGETSDEITGFVQTMRQFATPITTDRRPLVDTCGTGGDRSGTFNISTTAAFVVAGADVAVAKHGNRSASSKCGSADVLEELGVNVDASPEAVGRCIDEIGIGFLFARQLHPAMKNVAQTRQELKLRTVFNILGPLSNPAGADAQVVGVFNAALVDTMAEVLMNMGSRHALVVAGLDGLDEITLAAPTRVAETRDGSMRTFEINPGDVGIASAPRDALLGGDARENADILRRVLEGDEGPRRDVVLLNAGAAIMAGSPGMGWQGGVEAARESIDSGAALGKLEQLIRLTK
jgi:anthranilate phosphoribosyltransferase